MLKINNFVELLFFSKKKMTEKEKKQRRHTRAGIAFPPVGLKKIVKKRLPKRKLSKNTPIFMAGVCEHIMLQLFGQATLEVKKGTHIDTKHIHKASPALEGIFPQNIAGMY
jgi:hypothetical protein